MKRRAVGSGLPVSFPEGVRGNGLDYEVLDPVAVRDYGNRACFLHPADVEDGEV